MRRWVSKVLGGSQRRHADARSARSEASQETTERIDRVMIGRNSPGHQRSGATAEADATRRLSWPARDRETSSALPLAPNPVRGAQSAAATGSEPDDAPTQLVRPDFLAADEERTVLVSHDMLAQHDPVVGWLVVTKGPGKGRSIEIGMGVNAIGRAQGQKIRLDFGDRQIAREGHATIVYDPRSNLFILQHGDDQARTCVGDQPLSASVELRNGATISVGDTELRFVAFCDQDFRWP
jgi:hypothetical protein